MEAQKEQWGMPQIFSTDIQNAYKSEQICCGVVRIKRDAKKTPTEIAELTVLKQVHATNLSRSTED